MPIDEINKTLYPVLEDERAPEITDNFIKTIYKSDFKVEYVDNIES